MMQKENSLLLYCARTQMHEKVAHRVKKILKSNLDWDYITKKAMHHGISPLLYHNLRRIGNGAVPGEAMKKLRGAYYANVARNMFLHNELMRVARGLKDAGVPVIAAKGAALAEDVYNDSGLRPIRDVDILVRKEDMPRAKEKLSDLGYSLVVPDIEMFLEEFECEFHYSNRGKGVALDLHWNILHYRGYEDVLINEINKIFDNIQSDAESDFKVPTLPLEALLLHLCVHLSFRHLFSRRLIWFCDIHEVIRVYGKSIDWGHLIKIAKKYKVRIPVYHTLYYTGELLDTQIPSIVLKELKPRYPFQRIFESNWSKENILDIKTVPGNEGMNNLQLMVTGLLVVDRMQDRLKYLLRLIFPHSQRLRRIYSIPESRKIYIYYLIHPFRVFVRGIKFIPAFIRQKN